MSDRAQKAARGYVRRGLAVIPIPAGSKNPKRPGWESLRITEEEVPDYWPNGQNVGLLLGGPSGWRIDVDLDADASVRLAGRFLPATLASGRESRPHSHRWYVSEGAASQDWKAPDGKKLVELRSTGRQTLVAPSVHPDGDAYEWHAEASPEMAEIAPDELTSRCRELATAALIARNVPPQGSRHDLALTLAGLLLRPGRLDEETALKILRAAWHAAGADSREAVRDLEGIVRDTAGNLAAGQPVTGGTTLEETAPGVARVLGKWWGWGRSYEAASTTNSRESQPSPETFTAAELMAAELPPVRWAVPGVLPEGVTILAGKPKMGKSWLAYGLCVAVACGGAALGTIPVDKGEALYLALEDNKRRLQTRLRKLLGEQPAPEGLHLRLHSERLGDGGAEALGAWLAEHPDCRLVVIDTLKKVRPRDSGRRAVYDVDYESLEPLLPLAAEHGVSVLVVHHLRKMDADDPLDAISGSTGLTGGVDGTLILARQRGDADAFLHVDGRDVEEPRELALKWDQELVSWVAVGDAEHYRLSEVRREIIALLENAGEPMSARDIAIGIGKGDQKGYNATRQRLFQMSRDGDVKAAKRGMYVLHNKRNNVTNPPEEADVVTAVVTPLDDYRNNSRGEKPIGKPNVTDVMDVMADEDERNNGSPTDEQDVTQVVTRPDEGRNNVTTGPSVRALLSEPPDWLRRQMEHCREQGSPKNQIKALAASVAAHLLGTATRGAEALPAVEEFMATTANAGEET